MDIEHKLWGYTSRLFCKNNVEIHRIVGKLGGYCSKHKHINKFNLFFVESGKLLVKTWENDVMSSVILDYGQSYVILPNKYHMFEVLLDQTVAYEVYWTELDTTDIVRETVGGVVELGAHAK